MRPPVPSRPAVRLAGRALLLGTLSAMAAACPGSHGARVGAGGQTAAGGGRDSSTALNASVPPAITAAGVAAAPGRSTATPARSTAGPALERGIARADSLVTAAVDSLVPGAVLLVAKDGVVLHERAYGWTQLHDFEMRRIPAPRPVRTTTLFDLASVTKVMATTFAVMLLADRGQLDIEAPVRRYLPEFRGAHLDSITVRHLLEHSSGLAQWQPMYYQASTAAGTYDAIRTMPLSWGVGAERRYSDLGFMLLGYLVERVSGRRLDRFLADELYGPLGLRTLVFNPRTRGFTDFAATEQGNGYERRMVYDPDFGYDYDGDPTAWNGWRQYVLEGEVNDGNAWYAHGGVAGHAGLFGTAADLRVLLDVLNAGGEWNGRRIISAATIATFLTPTRFGHYLGWQVPRGLPDGSFAHSGFTGTWVLGVPVHGLSIVLLTNRQNLGTNERGYFRDVGPLQQAVARAIVRGAEMDADGSRTGSRTRGAGRERF